MFYLKQMGIKEIKILHTTPTLIKKKKDLPFPSKGGVKTELLLFPTIRG